MSHDYYTALRGIKHSDERGHCFAAGKSCCIASLSVVIALEEFFVQFDDHQWANPSLYLSLGAPNSALRRNWFVCLISIPSHGRLFHRSSQPATDFQLLLSPEHSLNTSQTLYYYIPSNYINWCMMSSCLIFSTGGRYKTKKFTQRSVFLYWVSVNIWFNLFVWSKTL